jgi:hypothetical protein
MTVIVTQNIDSNRYGLVEAGEFTGDEIVLQEWIDKDLAYEKETENQGVREAKTSVKKSK